LTTSWSSFYPGAELFARWQRPLCGGVWLFDSDLFGNYILHWDQN